MIKLYILLSTLVLSSTSFAKGEAEILKAYKREFAFLNAQKKSLKRRKFKINREYDKKLKSANQDLEMARSELIALTQENERFETQLTDLDKMVDESGENQEMMDTVLKQMSYSLKKEELPLFNSNDKDLKPTPENLKIGFFQSILALRKAQSIRTTPGYFFLQDGTKKEGILMSIGNIATFGISDKIAGALAPVGDGEFKLWPVKAENTARSLAAGKTPDLLKIFLYESKDKGITQKKEMGLSDTMKAGGPIAYVIVALGVFALFLILIRSMLLKKAGVKKGRLIQDINTHLDNGDISLAVEKAELEKGPMGRILGATLKNIGKGREHLENVIYESLLNESGSLDKFGTFILVLAAVSPLLGLLGTVTGMISTFDIITEFGTGDPKLLSSGISEALITTKLGLVVAIPTLLFGNLLSGWSERIKTDLESTALGVTNKVLGKTERA